MRLQSFDKETGLKVDTTVVLSYFTLWCGCSVPVAHTFSIMDAKMKMLVPNPVDKEFMTGGAVRYKTFAPINHTSYSNRCGGDKVDLVTYFR